MPLPPPPGVLGAIQAAPVGPSDELVQQVERPGPTRINASGYRDAIPTPSELPAPQYDKSFEPLPRTDWENLRQYKTFAERNPQVYAELQDTIKAPGFRDYMLMALANNGMPVAGAILNEKRARRAAIIENAESLARIEHLDQQSLGENVGAWRDAVSGSLEVNNTAYDREYSRQASGNQRANAYQSIANAAKADEEAETERQMRDPRVQSELEQAEALRANQEQSRASARSSDATAANTTADTAWEGETRGAARPYLGDMAQYAEREAEGNSRKAQADANVAEWQAENPTAKDGKNLSFQNTPEGFRLREKIKTIDAQVAPLNDAIKKISSYAPDDATAEQLKTYKAERGKLLQQRETLIEQSAAEVQNLQSQTVTAPADADAMRLELINSVPAVERNDVQRQIDEMVESGKDMGLIYKAWKKRSQQGQ